MKFCVVALLLMAQSSIEAGEIASESEGEHVFLSLWNADWVKSFTLFTAALTNLAKEKKEGKRKWRWQKIYLFSYTHRFQVEAVFRTFALSPSINSLTASKYERQGALSWAHRRTSPQSTHTADVGELADELLHRKGRLLEWRQKSPLVSTDGLYGRRDSRKRK